jgi:succinate-semialdehyde dehydrogenase/glutarate-semialdehyde dehydrogenase
VVVFDDVSVEDVSKTLVAAKFRNAGQVCISPTRFYVQEKVFDGVVKAFASAAEKIVIGDGTKPDTQMGPLANPRRIEAMETFISDAVGHGAELRTGGERIGNAGYFWRPTVLAHVGNEARIMNEEPFGPVAVFNPFRSFDDAVEQANRLPFGLAAYAFTQSAKTATAIGEAFESGLVGVNTMAVSAPEAPFGGVKESGYGSESGPEGLEAFHTTKFISQL